MKKLLKPYSLQKNYSANQQSRTSISPAVLLSNASRCIRPLSSSAGKLETFSTTSINGYFAVWYVQQFKEVLIHCRDVQKNVAEKIKRTIVLEGKWTPLTHYLQPEAHKKSIKWYGEKEIEIFILMWIFCSFLMLNKKMHWGLDNHILFLIFERM